MINVVAVEPLEHLKDEVQSDVIHAEPYVMVRVLSVGSLLSMRKALRFHFEYYHLLHDYHMERNDKVHTFDDRKFLKIFKMALI